MWVGDETALQALTIEVNDSYSLSTSAKRALCRRIVAAFDYVVPDGTVAGRPKYRVGDTVLYVGPFIAAGGYNRVHRGEYRGEKVAIRTMLRDPAANPKSARMFLLEHAVHAAVSASKWVPTLHAVLKTRRGDDTGCRLSSVMDRVQGVSMYDHIEANKPSDMAMLSMFTSVLAALHELDKLCSFEHRDLRADNVMVAPAAAATITVDNGDGTRFTYPNCGRQVSLVDFGFGRITNTDGVRITCNPAPFLKDDGRCPGIDAAMLLFTIVEDLELPPRFARWAMQMLEPLERQLRERIPLYYEYDDEDKWHEFQKTVYSLDLSAYESGKMIAATAALWEELVTG
jgi:serine/threonine protein kinase